MEALTRPLFLTSFFHVFLAFFFISFPLPFPSFKSLRDANAEDHNCRLQHIVCGNNSYPVQSLMLNFEKNPFCLEFFLSMIRTILRQTKNLIPNVSLSAYAARGLMNSNVLTVCYYVDNNLIIIGTFV